MTSHISDVTPSRAETMAITDLECRQGGEEGALEVDAFTEELLRVEDVTDAAADALTHREAHVQHLLTHAHAHMLRS